MVNQGAQSLEDVHGRPRARASCSAELLGGPSCLGSDCGLLTSCSYARKHQCGVLTLWPAYLFLPCDLRSSSCERKGGHPFPRLPGNSHLLHRGVLHRLHGGDGHPVPDEEHDQEAGLQQPAGCAQADQAHPPAETGNRK